MMLESNGVSPVARLNDFRELDTDETTREDIGRDIRFLTRYKITEFDDMQTCVH